MNVVLLAVLAIASSTAEAAIEHFRKGVELRENADLARPEFARSAAAFDDLWHETPSPAVALQRGRAHRLAGNLPLAILALRQGLAIAPADRDLQRALAEARAAVAYPIGSDLEAQCRVPTPRTLTTTLSPTQITILGGALWLTVCLALARFAMTRSTSWLGFAVASLIVLFVIAGFGWKEERERDSALPFAVVTEETHLRTGNATSYPPRLDAALPPGVEVKLLGERGGWRHVELANGIAGWLPGNVLMP